MVHWLSDLCDVKISNLELIHKHCTPSMNHVLHIFQSLKCKTSKSLKNWVLKRCVAYLNLNSHKMVTYPCRHSFWLTSLESFHFLHQISLCRCILCGCVRLARCWLVINRYHTVLTGVKKIRGRCETKDRSEAQERICLGSFTLYPICSFVLDLPSQSLSLV